MTYYHTAIISPGLIKSKSRRLQRRLLQRGAPMGGALYVCSPLINKIITQVMAYYNRQLSTGLARRCAVLRSARTRARNVASPGCRFPLIRWEIIVADRPVRRAISACDQSRAAISSNIQSMKSLTIKYLTNVY
jgi:hypothetical protein